jgi:probable F420-dependent oxidoreductase
LSGTATVRHDCSVTDVATPPRLLAALPVGSEPLAGDAVGLVDLTVACEGAGVDGIVLADHVVMASRPTGFPFARVPFGSDAPFLEPLTMAAAIAARTRSLLLATGILIVPLRPALLLAKTIATVDQLAGGRLELGVGIGWQREEYLASGIDPARRGDLLTDQLRACRALWGPGPSTFSSATTSFHDVWSRPTPTRSGGPPLLFAGRLTARTLERIIELGDGWLPMFGATRDDLARDLPRLVETARQCGRRPADLRVRVDLGSTSAGVDRTDVGALIGETEALLELGVTDVVLRLGPLLAAGMAPERVLDEAAERWRLMARR